MRIARSKNYGRTPVRFQLADAYALDERLGRFDAALAFFWWSHVPLGRFDNPIDVPAPRPQMDIEEAFAPFIVNGPNAVSTLSALVSGQQFTFTTSRGTQPTTIRETNVLPQGPVGDVFAYQSGHFSGGSIIAPNILFTALAGNNALVRSSPANIGLSDAALVIYR